MKQQASQELRRSHRLRGRPSNVKEKPTLMTLPAELRELIFYFAVVETEPIVACLSKRTVKRPPALCAKHDSSTCHWLMRCNKDMDSMVRQRKTFPETPHLMRVSHPVRKETRGLFWRENTFQFLIDDKNQRETQRWCNATQIGYATPRFKLLLEFTMEPIMGPCQTFDTIAVSLNAGHRLELTFGGGLVGECICTLVKIAAEISDDGIEYERPEGSVGAFASEMEEHVNKDFVLRNRRRDRSWRCPECKKPCTPPDAWWRHL